MSNTNTNPDPKRNINIEFAQSELDAVRDITKVDAVAPAVRAIVRQRIEDEARKNASK